jgi:hypothetical protein
LKNSIADKLKEWKHGFKSGTSDEFFAEYVIMHEMSWSMEDLDNLTEYDFLSLQKLLQIKNSVEKAEMKKNQNKNKNKK